MKRSKEKVLGSVIISCYLVALANGRVPCIKYHMGVRSHFGPSSYATTAKFHVADIRHA